MKKRTESARKTVGRLPLAVYHASQLQAHDCSALAQQNHRVEKKMRTNQQDQSKVRFELQASRGGCRPREIYRKRIKEH